jgi:lysylphosphatidylglycerol synthetase-like protein (DUF2156 family)
MIKSQKDFFTGLLFIAVGLFFFVSGWPLDYGTPADMGPGFLPLTISTMLLAIGVVQLARGIRSRGEAIQFNAKQPAIIFVAIIAFGFLLEKIGAVLAILLLMLVTAMLHKNFVVKSFVVSYLVVVGLLLIFKLVLRSTISL